MRLAYDASTLLAELHKLLFHLLESFLAEIHFLSNRERGSSEDNSIRGLLGNEVLPRSSGHFREAR